MTPVDPGKESRAAAGIPVVPPFDGFRAYAIMGIVVLHLLIASGVITGGLGLSHRLVQATLGQCVDALFVISGFVVFLPTVARRGEFGSVGAYAVRRAARLVPAYWLILALVLLLLAIVDLGGPTSFPGTGNIAVHAFYLQTPVSFVRDLHMGFGVDGPVWTLSLEVTFYILLPLVAGWYFRRPLLGLAIAAVITALWHEAIGHYDDLVSWLGANPSPSTSLRLQLNGLIQFPFFAFSFAAGMTGAWAYVRFRETATARHVRIAQLASLASLALFAFLVGHNATRGGVLFGAEFGRLSPIVAIGFSGSLAAVMVTTSLTGARSQRVFANPLARRLGDISYGIYLAHVVIIVYVLRLDVIPMEHRPNTGTILGGNGDLGSFLLLAAIVIPGAVLYGYLSARFVEQPIRRWAHRFGRRGQELAAAYTS